MWAARPCARRLPLWKGRLKRVILLLLSRAWTNLRSSSSGSEKPYAWSLAVKEKRVGTRKGKGKEVLKSRTCGGFVVRFVKEDI